MYNPWRLLPWLLLLLTPTLALGQDEGELAPDEASLYAPSTTERMLFHSPWYLPREVKAGVFVGNGPVVPELRLKWELTLYHFHRDTLNFDVEGGGGWGTALPTTFNSNGSPPLDRFYEHVALTGFGYRMDREGGFHFGVDALFGVLFYGGGYGPFSESNALGTFEGVGKVGWRFGHVVYGLFLADNVAFFIPPRSKIAGYTGGLLTGVFVNWH